jgi:hypothetical protein
MGYPMLGVILRFSLLFCLGVFSLASCIGKPTGEVASLDEAPRDVRKVVEFVRTHFPIAERPVLTGTIAGLDPTSPWLERERREQQLQQKGICQKFDGELLLYDSNRYVSKIDVRMFEGQCTLQFEIIESDDDLALYSTLKFSADATELIKFEIDRRGWEILRVTAVENAVGEIVELDFYRIAFLGFLYGTPLYKGETPIAFFSYNLSMDVGVWR